MDVYLQGEIVLKAISKTVIYPFSDVKRIFEMSYSYDLTLMALSFAPKFHVDPSMIVEVYLKEKKIRGKNKKWR